MDDWRIAYQQTGKPYVEPEKYIPCPGSVSLERAIYQTTAWTMKRMKSNVIAICEALS